MLWYVFCAGFKILDSSVAKRLRICNFIVNQFSIYQRICRKSTSLFSEQKKIGNTKREDRFLCIAILVVMHRNRPFTPSRLSTSIHTLFLITQRYILGSSYKILTFLSLLLLSSWTFVRTQCREYLVTS